MIQEKDILVVRHLSKIFYRRKFLFSRGKNEEIHKVFENVFLNLKQGEIVGLVAPNGAGKTTLLKIISGQLKQTSGEVLVAGSSHVNDLKMNTTIITSGGWIGLTVYATVEDNLLLFAKLSGLTDSIAKRKVNNALEALGLQKYKYELPTVLSSGLRQRLLLARVLVLTTPILILDEPTSNCDFYTRLNFYRLLLENVKKSKQAVIISTHKLSEIDQICDRLWFIKNKTVYSQDQTRLIDCKTTKCLIKVKSMDTNFLKMIENDTSVSDFVKIDKNRLLISTHLPPEDFIKNSPFLPNLLEFRIIKKSISDMYKEVYGC